MKKQMLTIMAEPAPDWAALVGAVAAARRETDMALQAVAAARRTFEEQARPLFLALEAAKATLATAEEALRTATLAAYAAAGSKRPHPTVAVRVQARLHYDREVVTTWCRANLPGALVLDPKTFERVAPTLQVPGVVLAEEPQATIAQDLTRWLPPALPLAAEPSAPRARRRGITDRYPLADQRLGALTRGVGSLSFRRAPLTTCPPRATQPDPPKPLPFADLAEALRIAWPARYILPRPTGPMLAFRHV